jgi:hypothetical protein
VLHSGQPIRGAWLPQHAPAPDASPPDAVGHLGSAWVLKSKAALLLAAVTQKQGPAAYEALVPQLVASAEAGPLQVGGHSRVGATHQRRCWQLRT